MIRSVVRGFGAALPKRVMTNREMEGVVDTSDEWIVQRTGIRQRYIAGDDETTASLGEAAARAALANGGLTPGDIDMIICATSTPDNTFPATSVNIQNRLGMAHGFAFDVQAVCTGFVYAVTTAPISVAVLPSAYSSSVLRPFPASSTGMTARHACFSETAQARSCWKQPKARGRRQTAAC
jgi:3-oxoacyl-(acyl-carrier-protein) synthase III